MEGHIHRTSYAPQYLDDVEQLIGMPFFADQDQASVARINPAELTISAQQLERRTALYIGGLRLLARGKHIQREALDQHGLDHFDKNILATVAARHREEVMTIRGGLMLEEPDLQPPIVKGLLLDLQSASPKQTVRKSHEKRGPAREMSILPPHLLPTQAIESIINIHYGGVLQSAKHRGVTGHLLKLPGPQPYENCYEWAFVAELAERRGLKPSVEAIDFTKLPRSDEESDEQKIAYAREVQMRHVHPLKLANVPELSEKISRYVNDLRLAGPQHVLRKSIERLAGPGFAFITSYCTEHTIPITAMRHPSNASLSFFMQLEDAAKVWDAYKTTPEATPDFITIINLAKSIGIGKYVVVQKMSDDEQLAMRPMRALDPPGRVLQHVPRLTGQAIIERLQARSVPPHLISVMGLDRRLNVSYSGIMQKISRFDIPKTKKVVFGNSKPVVLIDWEGLRQLDEKNLAAGAYAIDYDRLPRNEEDVNPERIAYARYVQNLYMPESMKPDQLRGAEAIQQGTVMTAEQIARFSGVSLSLIRQTIAERQIDRQYPPSKQLDSVSKTLQPHYPYGAIVDVLDYAVGINAETMQIRSGFTTAGLTLALSRLHIKPDSRFSPAVLMRVRSLRPPANALAVDTLAATARTEPAKIISFLSKHHTPYGTYLDKDGTVQTYVHSTGIALLQRQQDGERYPRATNAWLDRNRILAVTSAPINSFEAWLADALSSAPREPVRSSPNDLPRNFGWLKNDEGEVLQYFSIAFLQPYLKRYRRSS
jgi:hypothetical protein